MIVGQDRSGKTSLKKSLKGELFNPDEDSTLGIEVDPSLCQVTTEVWKSRETDEKVVMEGKFEQHAARLTRKNLMEQQSRKEAQERQQRKESISQTQVSHTRKDTRQERVSNVKKPSDEKMTKSNTDGITGAAVSGNVFPRTHATPEHKGSSAEKSSTMPVKVQKLLCAKSESMEEDDAIDFILWDFAGQSVFYTIHPLFMSRIAMYIMTHDLSKELDAKAVPLVKCGIYERIEDTKCEQTNMDYVHYWLSSVHAFSHDPKLSHSKSDGLPSKLPVVFLVCTHADQPAPGTKPKDVAMKIVSNLEGKSYKDHLHGIFTVDNTRSGGQDKDEEVERLKKIILQVAQQLPHIRKEIPLK